MAKAKVADLRKYYPDLAPVHTHSLAGMAVASLKKGLLPMTQTAMRFAKVAYHDSLAVGRSIAEAFNNAYRLERACRTQLLAQSCNDEILIPEKTIVEKTSRLYQPGVRRTMGVLEWPAMRRLADRLDPSYKN